MTCIAWDGAVLAADRRASNGTLIRTISKIRNFGDCLVGYTGDADAAHALLQWWKDSRAPKDWPDLQRDKDAWAGLLVVNPDKSLLKFERSPHPIHFPPQQFAVGSGRDFAMAAMHLGKSAPEAVAVAIEFDSSCGNGIEVASFSQWSGVQLWAQEKAA